MWFKNLIIFEFEETPEINEETFSEVLEKDRFKPCNSQQPNTIGWCPPMGGASDHLYHAGSKMFLLSARREERLLPAGVIKEALNEKVLEIEQREDRKVGRKQKVELREDLIFNMMPKAFTRSTRIQGLLIPELKYLVVDTTSHTKAEEWVSLLRQSMGSLSVKPIETKHSISGMMTDWLTGKTSLPSQVDLGQECVLQSPEESGAVVRCRRQDLTGDEIKAHLAAGKTVTQLEIEWKQTLSFVINESAEIKRLSFSDTIVEQAEVEGVQDEAAEFDARFTLMGLELSRFLPALWETLGGLRED